MHVQEMLEAWEADLTEAQRRNEQLSQALLDAWLRHATEAGAPEAAELRRLRLRLDLVSGAREADRLIQRIKALGCADPDQPPRRTATEEPDPRAATPAPEAEPPPAAPDKTGPGVDMADLQANPAGLARAHGADGIQRRHLAARRDRIQKIQSALMDQMQDVIRQNEAFGQLLQTEDASLRRVGSIEDLRELQAALIREVDRMRGGHESLAHKLDTAAKYLEIIGTEGKTLNEELTRAHVLSLTDELTDLPNRRAFLRRLEDEVARVQRYGYPLSLALIDMDSFKAINDRYGHAAGDEVLRSFAASMLSIFRHHDMVARYGGEEFAVLLPNTDRQGAIRALEKVRRRTIESSYRFDGRTMPMPTFSGGIALYRPGETPSSLIERADRALYQAKHLGRNRIEADQPDTV